MLRGSARFEPEKRIVDENGDEWIPATQVLFNYGIQKQRPDGSWRKPIRVKAGYVPKEEQKLYRPPHIVVIYMHTIKSRQEKETKWHHPRIESM